MVLSARRLCAALAACLAGALLCGAAHASVPRPERKPEAIGAPTDAVPPLPRPRPGRDESRAGHRERASLPPAATAPAPAGCEAKLAAAGVRFTRADPIREGACGAEAPVRVEAIAGVRLTPAATLRCPAALAAAQWVERGLVPAGRTHLGGQPTTLRVAASYHCRTRRNGRGPSRRLSEHALANALDVRAVAFADGREIAVMPKGSGRSRQVEAFQAAIRAAACESFTTVIGPGTDPAHRDHLHFDLAERRGGYRLCR